MDAEGVDPMALERRSLWRWPRHCLAGGLTTLLFGLGLLAAPALAGSGTTRVEVLLQGMACSLCSGTIEERLQTLAAAGSVKLDLEQRLLSLTLRPGLRVSDAQLRSLLREVGYNVREIRRLPASP
jgi:copper chaperone CopZ